MKENTKQQLQNAICVKDASKQFSIPHEKINTLRGAFVNVFRKKTFESFYALKDISFEVKKGEFFGIIGRNGSGKSTLLKILAGVYVTDKGKVEINGLISPFLELGIGFNSELSGRDNIYLNATVLGLTKKEIDEKFDSIVSFSELERFIDQKLKNYSSGMSVRLAFSVAIHANRDILLMDEVLAVGDANFQSKCLEEFNRYKEMGKTIILVTHDIATIQKYCDRAVLLRNGEIEMIGNPEEVVNEYICENLLEKEKQIIKEQDQEKSFFKPELQNFINKNLWLKQVGIKTILDIGANEGQFAEKITTLLPEAKIICFEPLQEPFEKLKRKFIENKNFSFFKIALGNKEGYQKIFRNEYSPSSSILKMKSAHKNAFDFARQEFEEEIKIGKLDNIMRQIKVEKPYLVKMDVQGYETEVIDGGIKVIENASLIILETSFIELYESAPLFDSIYEKLKALNFEYIGSMEQLLMPTDGKVLQQDSIFQKII